MPREWYDRHHASKIEDEAVRDLYLSILADKKPYFMKYIYPDLMRQYNTYIKNTEKKSMREFSLTIDELLSKKEEDLTEVQAAFIDYYWRCMPVGVGDCVTNKICRRFEQEFDGYLKRHNSETTFDYALLRGNSEYSKSQKDTISSLLEDYNRRIKDYSIFVCRERVDGDEAASNVYMMGVEFRAACDQVCPNSQTLCDILLDLCYKKSSTKGFVWNMCAEEIMKNVLDKNNYIIHYPVLDPAGEVEYGGFKFTYHEKRLEESNEYSIK